MTDEEFFANFPSRQTRIRLPGRELHKDQQRSVRYLDESELQFRSLGPHDVSRRRMLLYRIPRDNPMWDPENPQILKIPFLAFADETIENEDHVLLPIIQGILTDAARRG